MHCSRSSLAMVVAVALILAASLSLLAQPADGMVLSHPLSKRSFFDIECKGVYDKGIFARLDRICEDCYNLFREPQLHSLCRSQCFSTQYFKGCLDTLLLNDEEHHFNAMIDALGKKK